MRGHLQVQRGGSLADSAGRVVVRPVTGTVVAPEVPGVGDGHATQMGAHTDNDQPLGVLRALVVVLRVAQSVHGDRLLGGNLVFGSVNL